MGARRVIALAMAGLLAGVCVGCSTTDPAASGGSSGAASAAIDGAALVQQRCTRCHPTDRIDAAAHDLTAWQATIARMRGKGAQLTDAEAAALAKYLATR